MYLKKSNTDGMMWPHSAAGNESDRLTADPEVASLIPVRSHTFVEIDHEIISMFIYLLPLIQEGLLSVTSEIMCTKYWLTA